MRQFRLTPLTLQILNLMVVLAMLGWSLAQSATFSAPRFRLVEVIPAESRVYTWFLAFDPDSGLVGSAENAQQLNSLSASAKKDISLRVGHIGVTASGDASYYGISSVIEGPEAGSKLFRLEIYSSQQAKLYQIERPHHFDESLPVVLVSNAANVVLGYSHSGELLFFDRDVLKKQVKLFPEALDDLERFLEAAFKNDGTRLAVLATKRGASPFSSSAAMSSGEPHVLLLDASGVELWRAPLPHFSASALAFSPDGQSILAATYTADMNGAVTAATSLLNDRGQTKATFDYSFWLSTFSENSHYAVVASKKSVQLIDLGGATTLWSKPLSPKQGLTAVVRVSNNGALVALLAGEYVFENDGFIYREAKLKILDAQGKAVQDIPLEGSFVTPAMTATPDLRRIAIGLRDGHMIFEAVNEN